jgi:hypothetical protein
MIAARSPFRIAECHRFEGEIEAILERRTGRIGLYFPSGRLALYAALRALMRPRSKILMSPVTDDVIFFIVLAAGLRPTMAPLSVGDGNIDPSAVPEATWRDIGGVLTTNLYGLPDRVRELRARCNLLQIPLIEDVAHAIESDVDGLPVGTFGDAAAFSLAKHGSPQSGGGVLVCGADLREEIDHIRAGLLVPRPMKLRVLDAIKPSAKRTLGRIGLLSLARGVGDAIKVEERTGYRMDLRPQALREAIAAGPDLGRFEPWVRVDRALYRTQQSAAEIAEALRCLREVPKHRGRRLEGVRRLAELDVAAPGVRGQTAQPLFRVPLLVKKRDKLVAELARREISITCIYDPPLDDYAGDEFADPSALPGMARWYARHVLPIDPLQAEAVLAAFGELAGELEPAPVSGTPGTLPAA